MSILRIIENDLTIDFTKYRIIKINKRYKELKEKMNQLEQQRCNLDLALASMNRQIFLTKQEIDKLEQEIINDVEVK